MSATTPAGVARQPRGRPRDPLLLAKITVPGLPAWAVSRPRLDTRLAAGVRGPLTSVTGPPGAGKTVAVASWAAGHRSGPVAWLTLDEFDNKPGTFWSYVVAALRQAGVNVSRAASALADGNAAGHVFLLQLASALAAHDPPVVLVIDDLHLLTDAETLGGLAYVLRNARSGLHVVVASRIDPLLPLHQYRLAGELAEIRAGDLAFSVPEAALLMAQHGVALPAGALELITERDEGWAAGLRMAAISMDGHPDPELFVKSLASGDSPIAAYLVEEVLNSEPGTVRDLLLRTSVLDEVTAELARDLTGDEHAASTLERLARVNSFIQPVGQGWYRYHSLFRSVLHLKLRREEPDLVAELYRRAARWYQRKGCLAEAVRHAGQADDWRLASRIVVDELAVGRLGWPDHGELPADGFRRTPEDPVPPQFMLAAAAAALADGRAEAGGASLAIAEHILGRLPDDQEVPSRFAAATIRFGLGCRAGDFRAAHAAAAAAERLLDSVPESLRARHPEAAGTVLYQRAIIELWSGDLEMAAGLLRRSAQLLGEAGSGIDTERTVVTRYRYDLATCHGYLALLEALHGRLGRAATMAGAGAERTAATAARADGRTGHGIPPSALALAIAYLERGELSAARGRLKAAEAALRTQPVRLLSALGCLVAASGSLAEGRAGAALEVLRQARDGWLPPPWLERLLTVTQARAHIASGDTEAALAAARAAGPAPDAKVALARAWLAAGNLEAARQALARGAEALSGGGPDRVRVEAWLADALLGFREGDAARGHRSLERALRLAQPQRLRLPFATERRWIRPALARYPELAHAYSDLLEPGLLATGWIPRQRHAAGEADDPVIVEQLSSRERDVLTRVAEMLSTADIAADMYISVNTVKTHLKSIFRKLGAADRREAVRRARQLNLLPPSPLGQDAGLPRPRDGVLPGGHPELAVDRPGVGLDRVSRHVQLPADLPQGERSAQQVKHGFLTLGEPLGQRRPP
ncbi:MAG: AAA family ATPase [Streptosporangiaceae bacterium]|nr:AAA family ATPase [Streptosporangiaceae bacterium]MBV9855733.1 AAA family ATPase [Streptosporangiaceae bacterium]